MTSVICVAPAHVKTIWPHVEHYVRRAVERVGLVTLDDVAADVLDGTYLLWIGWDNDKIIGALVTALYPDRVHIVAYGGRLKDLEFLPIIENYARAEGCKKLCLTGRKGWVRVLKDFHQPYVVLEKELY